jgi:outer membrane lipoprotein-sorting protein
MDAVMKTMFALVAGCAVFLFLPVDSYAQELEAVTILATMKEAFEPSVTSTRMVTITLKSAGTVTARWVAHEARKKLPDGKKSLLVMLEPDSIKGVARLISENNGSTNAEFVYFPSLQRIREFHPVMASDPFLNTDFTYADLGFIRTEGTTSFAGIEHREGTKAYRMETVLDNHCYYARIVSWVSCRNYLPLQREYYDAANRLWKTQYFEDVVVINDIPTPLLIRMVDHENGTSTEYKISEVCYGANVPDDVFEINRLSRGLESTFCIVRYPGE